jgi:hypothetical protein
MSTDSRARVSRGVSTGGQFATEARAEDATVSLVAAPQATRDKVVKPARGYSLERTADGTTYNDSRGSWPMQTVEPTTHSEAKRALSAPGLRGGGGRVGCPAPGADGPHPARRPHGSAGESYLVLSWSSSRAAVSWSSAGTSARSALVSWS